MIIERDNVCNDKDNIVVIMIIDRDNVIMTRIMIIDRDNVIMTRIILL
jgi:hypothetical protein